MSREELRQRAKALVAEWPPLTSEQHDRLAALLRPASSTRRAAA